MMDKEPENILVEVVDEVIEVLLMGLGSQALATYPLYLVPGMY